MTLSMVLIPNGRVKGGLLSEKPLKKLIDDFDFSAPFKSVVPLLEVKSMILELQDDHWKKCQNRGS